MVPTRWRDATDRLEDINGGVVHQHIEVAELGDCMLNEEVAAFGIGCVESSGHRLAAIRVDGIRGSSRAILVDVGDHYLRAVSGQPSRERLAKAARGTGDDCDATRQIEQCGATPSPSLVGRRQFKRSNQMKAQATIGR